MDTLVLLTPFRGIPPSLSKLGTMVTQTSVFAILVYQSTHAIYHIKLNFRSNDVLHA